MKNKFIKILSVMLCAVSVVSFTVSPVAAAYESDYPEGVTREEVATAVESTETLLKKAVPVLTGKTLSQNVKPLIYNSEVLSSVVLMIYRELSAKSDELESAGIDISVSTVAESLGGYPEVVAALSKAESWEDVNLDGVDWGVNGKNTFSTALGRALAPFDDVLYLMFCSGTLSVSKFIKIEGVDGYQTAVVPILEALKCPDILTQNEFTAAADADKGSMVKNILVPVLSVLEQALETPVTTLTDVLPSFAYFVENGGLDKCFGELTDNLKEKNSTILEIASFFNLFDDESFDFDISSVLTDGVSGMTSQINIKTAEIDLAVLAKCGREKDGTFVSDKCKAYVVLMRWIIDTLKLNEKQLPELMKSTAGSAQSAQTDYKMVSELLGSLFKEDTDALVSLIVKLFTPSDAGEPSAMVYPDITAVSVDFTPNLTRENYDKVLDEIDDLLNEFIKESGQYKNIETMLKNSVYTEDNINSIFKGLYEMMAKEGMIDMLSLLNVDISTKGVADSLRQSGYSSVADVLKKYGDWNKVPFEKIKWNFYDGSRRGFQNALTAVLKPLFPLLRVLLAEEDIVILDCITFKGGDGYNTAVIPILEALGCKPSSIKSYSQYLKRADTDDLMDYILDPVFDLLDDVFEEPVKKLTEILPNIVYFMNSGSVEKCISNLFLPVTAFSDKISAVYDMNIDTSSFTEMLDVEKMMNSVIEGSGMKIAEFDINKLAGMGTLTQRTSKSVLGGDKTTYSYVKADQTAVLMSFLRVLAKTIKMPGNENLITGAVGGGSGTFAAYSSSIGEQFAEMTEDEIIEWLYNLLFKERVQVELVFDEETYSPTIIYKQQQKNYTPLYILGGYFAVAAIVAVIMLINKKRLYY